MYIYVCWPLSFFFRLQLRWPRRTVSFVFQRHFTSIVVVVVVLSRAATEISRRLRRIPIVPFRAVSVQFHQPPVFLSPDKTFLLRFFKNKTRVRKNIKERLENCLFLCQWCEIYSTPVKWTTMTTTSWLWQIYNGGRIKYWLLYIDWYVTAPAAKEKKKMNIDDCDKRVIRWRKKKEERKINICYVIKQATMSQEERRKRRRITFVQEKEGLLTGAVHQVVSLLRTFSKLVI